MHEEKMFNQPCSFTLSCLCFCFTWFAYCRQDVMTEQWFYFNCIYFSLLSHYNVVTGHLFWLFL